MSFPAADRTVGSAMDDTHRNPNKVFVGGLGQNTTTASLRNYFNQYGRVVDAAVVTDKITGRSRGFGFCSFSSEDLAERCLLVPHKIDGVAVEIRRAVPRDEARSAAPYDSVEQAGKIHISGLPHETTEDQLKAFFEGFGPVQSATLVYDKNNHRPRGFGFVTFVNPEEADAAVGQHSFDGHLIEAKKAVPRSSQNDRARQGYGGRGYDRFPDPRRDYGYGGMGRGYGPPYAGGYYDHYGSPGGYGPPHPASYGGYGGHPGGYGGVAPYGTPPHYGGYGGSAPMGHAPPGAFEGYGRGRHVAARTSPY